MNKKSIFITATNTEVGKSYASEVLLKQFAKDGLKVGYFKPVETGVVGAKPVDGSKLLSVARSLNPDFDFDLDMIVPYQFELPASVYVAKGKTEIDIRRLKSIKNELLKKCDALIIEGAGGLLVPIELDYFMIDLIKDLADETILISPSNLGSINDTLLSIEALKSRDINHKLLINLYRDKHSFEEVTMPFYRDYFSDVEFL
jgi:dethiobiotin synthetase